MGDDNVASNYNEPSGNWMALFVFIESKTKNNFLQIFNPCEKLQKCNVSLVGLHLNIGGLLQYMCTIDLYWTRWDECVACGYDNGQLTHLPSEFYGIDPWRQLLYKTTCNQHYPIRPRSCGTAYNHLITFMGPIIHELSNIRWFNVGPIHWFRYITYFPICEYMLL